MYRHKYKRKRTKPQKRNTQNTKKVKKFWALRARLSFEVLKAINTNVKKC